MTDAEMLNPETTCGREHAMYLRSVAVAIQASPSGSEDPK